MKELAFTGDYETISKRAREQGYTAIAESVELDDSRIRTRYAPEIIIAAGSRLSAQRALNLMSATSALWHASLMFEEFAAIPSDRKKPEGLSDWQLDQASGQSIATNGLWIAARIAAKATWRTNWQFAVAKYLLSLKIASVHPMDHAPSEGLHYGIEKDPVEIVRMSQAVASQRVV
jgi:hypothetical protein